MAIEIVVCCLFICIAAPSALREIDKEIHREYEDIHKVHMHLDDDHSGTVDKHESAEVSSHVLCVEHYSSCILVPCVCVHMCY